jgi:hypothetical protein
MSVTRISSIHCDGCGVWHYGNIGESMAEVRRGLRRIGWAVSLPGGRDLCPKCRQSEAKS